MATVHKLRDDEQAGPDLTANLEAEQALIGAALEAANRGNRDVLASIRAPLLIDAFATREHREIWRAMCALHAEGAPITAATVCDWITRRAPDPGITIEAMVEWTERVGDYYAPPSQARYYAEQLREAQTRRAAIAIATELTLTARSDRRPSADWLPDLAVRVAAANVAREVEVTLGESVAEALTVIEQRASGRGAVGIPTGLASLDQQMGGFHAGRYVVIAGRTSMGKSAMALTIARHILARGNGVGILSFEMSRFELVQRLIAMESGVSLSNLARGWRQRGDVERISAAAEQIGYWPLQIHDAEASWTVAEQQIRRQVASGARVVVIDHIGLIHYGSGKVPRWEQVGTVSKALKRLARLLDVTIVALCQINREVGQQKDRRPQLWMLRDAGSIEEDADEVLLLHRPGYYEPGAPDDSCECVIAKDRHGPTGKVNLRWRRELAMFEDTAGAFDDDAPDGGGWR